MSSAAKRCVAWRALVLAGALVGFGPASAAAAPAGQPELVQPVLQNSATVEYPEHLLERDARPAGEVIVKFVVGTDGVPKELSIERSVHPDVDAVALEAVKTLRYEPATYDGKPVEVVMRIALEIGPPEPEPAPEPEPEPKPAADAADDDVEYAPEAEAKGPVRIEGTILEAGQRTPVRGATVVAVPAPADAKVGHVRKKTYGAPPPKWSIEAVTDDEGKFELRGVPDGKTRLIILTQGYRRLEFIEDLEADESLTVRYYQTRESSNPYRTVVRTTREEREEVARRTITVEEINALPGTQGDALKSIQNFPGVARSPFGIGLLVIRGSAPQDSAIFLGYHEIPQLFHFGGLTSVFNSDILTQIDYIPGNFDSRYGDATGGVINVVPRKGRRDGYHGYIDSDLFDTGVLFEGPIGKGSFVLSGRRSYIDLLLPVFIPDDAGLDFTIAPRYWDYQALFDYPISGGDFSVRVFGSDDRTKLVAIDEGENDIDDRNRFETTVFFHRADLAYRKREGPWEFMISPSYRYDSFDFGIGDLFRFDFAWHMFSGRAEVSRRLTKRLAWRIGTETIGGTFEFDAQAPPVPAAGDTDGSTDTELASTQTGRFFIPALYTTFSIGLGDRFTLYPGVRLQYYSEPFNTSTTDPRLRFAWQVADRTTIKGGAGIYSQAPDAPEFDETWGNPRIGPEHAFHGSLGVAQEFEHAISVEATGFYKYLWDLAVGSDKIVVRPDGTIGPESFANDELGRIYGAELLARKDLTGNLFGWISYTLMRSERKHRPGEPWVKFDFDQTHILTLIGVYKLPRNWQFGARFRLVSGNPTTPVIGAVYDANEGFYLPINGRENSDRLPMFHQLDLRIDKKWVYRKVSFNLYLDVQNVYNRQNSEFVNYNFDYTESQFVPSLPIIPSIGLKLEF